LQENSKTTQLSSSKSSIIGLSALRMIRLVVSLATIALSAKYFGASVERDLWILALASVNFVQSALWGPINETFRAKFIFLREEEGEMTALKRARSLFLFTNLVTIIGFGIFMIFHYPTSQLVAPGNSGKELAQLDFMLQILGPSLLLTQITFLLSSILNAYGTFYIPEITGFISSLFNILFFIILVPHIGIYSLAVSYYLGLIMLLGMLVYQIHRQQIPFFRKPFTLTLSDVKPYLIFALPFFIPYFFSQLNGVSEKSIATLIGVGSISIVDYARKFIDIPMGVLYSVLNTIMIPVLSQQFTKNDIPGFRKEFKSTFQLGLMFMGVFVSILLIGSGNIIDFAYNLGKMNTDSLDTISSLSVYYGFSALTIFCFSILGFSLISLQQNKIYALCSTIAHVIIIAINMTMYKKFGVYIFPVSLIIAYTLNSLILLIKLQKIVGSVWISLMRYILFIAIISLIGYFAGTQLFIDLDYPSLAILALKILSLLVVALLLTFFMKLEERVYFISYIAKAKIVVKKIM
jgi:putative peptidoglycan lipid II flippase